MWIVQGYRKKFDSGKDFFITTLTHPALLNFFKVVSQAKGNYSVFQENLPQSGHC